MNESQGTFQKGAPVTDRRALAFILLTVTLDSMGAGILIPVIPQLILELGGAGLAGSAIYGGWLIAVFAIVQFLASPFLGSLSDWAGRRPVLLISLAAFGCSYVLMGFAPTLGWLFIAQALTGLFGATPSTAGAYIADISSPALRTRRFGTMGAAFGTGIIIGPVIGGLLVGYGTRLPFFVAAALSLLTVVYGVMVLPESLKKSARRPLNWRRANPVGAFQALRHVHGVSVLLGVVFLQRLAVTTLPSIWPYFTMQVYHWTPRDVGLSLALFGMCAVTSQAVIVGRVDQRIGTHRTIGLGLSLVVAGYVGFAFVSGPWVPLVCVPLSTMGFMSGPALISLLSRRTPADEQGAMQGAIASINGLAAVCAPLIMPWLFYLCAAPAARWYFPGAPFLLAAMLAGLGVWMIGGARETQQSPSLPAITKEETR